MTASPARRWGSTFALVVAACIGIVTVVAAPQEATSDDSTSDDDAAKTKQEDGFVARFVRAQRLLGKGSDDEAEKVLRQLIVERPEEAAVHHALAVLLQFRKRPADATTEFLTAARLAPEEAVIQRDTGLHLLAVGRPADAEPYLATACRVGPEDVESSVGRAAALRATGRLPQAEAEYRRAIAVDSNSIDAAVGLAACIVDGKPADALKLVERATGQWPDVLLVRGMALLRLDRYDEAVASLAKVVEVAQPGAAGVAFVRGAAENLALCGDAKLAGVAAAKWFETESAAGAPSEEACACLAVTREATGDHAGALSALDALKSGGAAATKLLRAVVLVRLGRKDAATSALEDVAASAKDEFESAAASRLLGRTSAPDLAKLAAKPGRANDVAWIESIVAETSGDAAAATAARARAAELSKPRGEFPGLLVRPSVDGKK